MPTHITQDQNPETGLTVLKVKGEMHLEDAVLLERLANNLTSETGKSTVIDLADLDFLDSESAAVLKRLADNKTIVIEGMEIFLQTAVNEAERKSD